MKAEPPEDWEIYLYFCATALHPSPDVSCALGHDFSTENGFLKFSVDINCEQKHECSLTYVNLRGLGQMNKTLSRKGTCVCVCISVRVL